MSGRYCAGLKKACERRSIVRHLSDGALRWMYAEPLGLGAANQERFDGWAQCKARFDRIAGAARLTGRLLAAPVLEPAPAAAFASLQQRIRREASRPAPWYQRW